MTSELIEQLKSALKAIPSSDFRAGHLELLKALGYTSDKAMPIPGATPSSFVEMAEASTGKRLQPDKARLNEWTKADILFQLTDAELSGQASLFEVTKLKPGLLQSYLFFAIELNSRDYSRTALAQITRQINRLFPMPVMILFTYNGTLSIAVINRRKNKLEAHKDVLGKVTLIHGINLSQTHRGHLEILESFSVPSLTTPKRKVESFDALHTAWETVFNVELLNHKFYRELSSWYFWATRYVHFPHQEIESDKGGLFKDQSKVREHDAKNLIRLLSRILFVWFIKQRQLVPDEFFDAESIAQDYLEDFDSESKETRYYKAILQNFFFAALNQKHGDRGFRRMGTDHRDNTALMRYKDEFIDSNKFVKRVEEVTPFLNGGLFECLDYIHPTETGPKKGKRKVYEDGFSDRKDNPLTVPDFLFFGKVREEDLSEEFGDNARKQEEVRGLIHILDSYKFTIVENTPIEQEIALDPELLGQVFENLLASYNPETKVTARKQTGSFYTPRPIVDYMVDESIKAHLLQTLTAEVGSSVSTEAREETQRKLDELFAYNDKPNPFVKEDTDTLISAIDNCKILDPACGSGAFPMGTLQKLVYILSKLDPRDKLWEHRQLAKVDRLVEAAGDIDIDDTTFRERAIEDAEEQKKDIEDAFAKNELGYGRKLYLIENCLYGVDIQSIATQVTKLRFFISLIVDQKIDDVRKNFGVRPLPNLETKFVTADTLIGIDSSTNQTELSQLTSIDPLKQQLKEIRHKIFSVRTGQTKQKYRKLDKAIREEIAEELKLNGWENAAADKLAAWDPYDQNGSASYFDAEWMFGTPKFDVVIGNPPYIQIQKFPKAQKDKWLAQEFQTYAAMADIYCLFYERGAQLLKPNGHLAYITSNKWMRAGYGEKLRVYLSSQVDTNCVFDFGMAQNFGAATTYTCITQFTQRPSRNQLETCYATDDKAAMTDPAAYFSTNAVVQKNLSGLPWVILSPERFAIKQQVEAQGIPLAEWDISIYRGVLTGFNDAFYITKKEYEDFIAEDPKCADYLVPLLRGRYVSRYSTNWDDTWMIATFPVLKLDFNQLPEPIQKRLLQYKDRLEPKPKAWKGGKWKGRKAGAYRWFETQDVIGYHRDFQKPKVMYPNMTKFLPFFYDQDDRFFTNDKGFIITTRGDSIAYLTGFLNSALFKCCFRDNFPELMGNTYEVRKIFVEIIPVKKPTTAEVELFEKLVPLVQAAKKATLSVEASFLETLIDACVMECYFREHMAKRNLLFHDLVAKELVLYSSSTGELKQTAVINAIYEALNAPTSKVRNRLLRIPTDSPELLAVIQQEGKL